MSFLQKYWKKYKWLFLFSISCVIGETVCDLIQPQIMARLIDDGVQKLDMQYVINAGLLMLAVTGIGAIFACVRNYLSSKTSQGFGASMRHDLFVKMQSLPISETDRFEGGSLVTRMTNDVSQFTNFINGLMRIFFKAPITCIGAIFLSINLNVKTAPIVISIVAVCFLSIGLNMRLTYPIFARVQKAIDKLNNTVREYLMGIRLVKAFGRYKLEENRFKDANENLSHETIKGGRVSAILGPISNLAANVGVALIVILGSRWVGSGEMQVGQIVAFITYMLQILSSISMIGNILNTFVRTKASYVRIAEVMNIDKSEREFFTDDEKEEAVRKDIFDNSNITFENVGFTYPTSSGESALKNISFSVNRGETLAIIGPTGSGKSTIAALLLHFYKTNEGVMRFGNCPISELPVYDLRQHVAIVPQTPTLFKGSIIDNLYFGRSDATEEEIDKALEISQAKVFVSNLKNGIHTYLGQSGINLSGGQKQRISIARALVSKPDILVLDDCTSALDSITEAKVRKGLREFSEDLTCVLISQRISSVMSADKILVLDNGEVSGIGKHSDLMQTCEVYRDIYVSQIGRETL